MTKHLFTGLTLCALALGLSHSSSSAQGQEAKSEFASAVIDTGLVVTDLKKSIHFYTQAIGFKEIKGFSVPANWTREVGLTDGKTLDIHVLVLGDGPQATKLKLMQAQGEVKKNHTKFILSETGMRYLTIQVADIDAAVARLKKAGAKTVSKGDQVNLPEGFPTGVQLTCVKDPDGNMIELVGPTKKK